MRVFSVQTLVSQDIVEFADTDTCTHINVVCIDISQFLTEACREDLIQLTALPCQICSIDSVIVSASSASSWVAFQTIHSHNAIKEIEQKGAPPVTKQLQLLPKTTIKSYKTCKMLLTKSRLCLLSSFKLHNIILLLLNPKV